MATFVILVNWTDQGIRTAKDAPNRAAHGEALAEQMGAKLKEVNWTLGAYDVILKLEAPDEETATAFALAIGMQGNARTTTLRAYGREEMEGILARLG